MSKKTAVIVRIFVSIICAFLLFTLFYVFLHRKLWWLGIREGQVGSVEVLNVLGSNLIITEKHSDHVDKSFQGSSNLSNSTASDTGDERLNSKDDSPKPLKTKMEVMKRKKPMYLQIFLNGEVSLKLLLSFFQVISAAVHFAEFEWPSGDITEYFEMFDFFPFQSAASLIKCGGSKELTPIEATTLVVFVSPIIVFIILAIVLLYVREQHKKDPKNYAENMKALYSRGLKVVIWACLLSYPLVSKRLLEMFNCRGLGVTGTFAISDYSFECSGGNYQSYSTMAAFGIIIYVVGVPFFFYTITENRYRDSIFGEASSILWKNVKPSWCYFEVLNLVRKFLLTSVAIFVYNGSSPQFLFLFVINNAFLVMLTYGKPYEFHCDNIAAIALALTECLFFLVALVVKSDSSQSQLYGKAIYHALIASAIITTFFVLPVTFAVKFKRIREYSPGLNWLYNGEWKLILESTKRDESTVLLMYKMTVSMLGNVVLLYNFSLYGGFSDVFGDLFFSKQSSHNRQIATAFVFGLAYIFRPVGGYVATKLGRIYTKQGVIEIMMLVMTLSTFFIGCIPTWDQVGAFAPTLLVLLRAVQGIACGGELIPSIVFAIEVASPNEVGFWGSVSVNGIMLGLLASFGLVAVVRYTVTTAQLQSFGWRIPFLISPAVFILGIYVRRRFLEQNISVASNVVGSQTSFKDIYTSHFRKVHHSILKFCSSSIFVIS